MEHSAAATAAASQRSSFSIVPFGTNCTPPQINSQSNDVTKEGKDVFDFAKEGDLVSLQHAVEVRDSC